MAVQQLVGAERGKRGERYRERKREERGYVCKHCKHCKIFARRFLLNHWKSLLIPLLTLHMAHTAGQWAQWDKGTVDSGIKGQGIADAKLTALAK